LPNFHSVRSIDWTMLWIRLVHNRQSLVLLLSSFVVFRHSLWLVRNP
jgi:hypothetical protein